MKIVGICGSLRKDSFNKKLILEFGNNLPKNIEFEILDISNLPLYDDDFQGNLPDVVKNLKEKIKNADAILLVSPEYNYSFSGVIKNSIDWASRPMGDNSFGSKPAAIMGASNGKLGTARMQYQLRQVGVALDLRVMNTPEFMLTNSAKQFDDSGHLIDPVTIEQLKKFVNSFLDWIEIFVK